LETTLRSTTSLYTPLKKLGIFVLILIISAGMAAVYGVIHDQITYTISSEYYTKFKFEQFGLDTHRFGGIRNTVAITGIIATWWVGLVIGFVQGTVGLMHRSPGEMFHRIFKALLCTILITFCTGLSGFIFSFFSDNPDWWFPEDLQDKRAYITVGFIHNYGYVGVLLGLIGGVILQFRLKKKNQI
jgi:hypothetical protein